MCAGPPAEEDLEIKWGREERHRMEIKLREPRYPTDDSDEHSNLQHYLRQAKRDNLPYPTDDY